MKHSIIKQIGIIFSLLLILSFPLFLHAQIRNEKFPIGTKIYQEGTIGNRRLLLTVEKGLENKTIDLLE